MWIYNITSGALSKDGTLIDPDCYSGAFPGIGFDNPSEEAVKDEGPLPEGDYDFVGQPFTDPTLGPYVLKIEPRPGTNTFGRSGFFLHGKPLPPADIRSGSK